VAESGLPMAEKAKYVVMASLVTSFVMYSLYIYQQPVQLQAPGQTATIVEGKMIWQQKNCGACHQIYGLGGFLGPDLTNIYSARGKGPAYIQAFVNGGTSVMPSFQLEEGEMSALLAYLRHVDASGKSDPKQYKINYDGTIESP